MKIENCFVAVGEKVEVAGKIYIASERFANTSCKDCAAWETDDCLCQKLPNCHWEFRDDGNSIIFKELNNN